MNFQDQGRLDKKEKKSRTTTFQRQCEKIKFQFHQLALNNLNFYVITLR